jgi:hypothetical protein
MRLVLALAALTCLTACNVVVTKTPLFVTADETGAPSLRTGVWRMGEDADCKVDEGQPLADWPSCSGGAVVSPGEIAGHDKKDGKDVIEHDPFVMAAGDPRIVQLRFKEHVEGATTLDEAPFGYAGARATKLDGKGRITGLTYWLVQCGPPPPKTSNGKTPALGTLHPLRGMEMKPGDAMCTTSSRDALRAAAKASEAWKEKPLDAHWVRDGDR